MRKHSKKLAVAAAALSVLVAGGIAFAYFTNAGSGSGNATVGTSSHVIITNTTPEAQLLPGGPSVTVPVQVQNPGSGNQYVGTITGTVENTGPEGACLGSWFTVAPNDYNTDVPAGVTLPTSTSITFNNIEASQDACQGATLTIDWSSN